MLKASRLATGAAPWDALVAGMLDSALLTVQLIPVVEH